MLKSPKPKTIPMPRKRMWRSSTSLVRFLKEAHGFSATSSEKIVASVLFERLPVIIPKIDPVVYAFQELSFRWRQQYRRKYPNEFLEMSKSNHAIPTGKPVWHFPEKAYDSEETLHKCAESAFKSVIGDLSNTYFVGSAPMGHMAIQQTEKVPERYKRLFFKSQVIDTNKYNIGKCEDSVWDPG